MFFDAGQHLPLTPGFRTPGGGNLPVPGPLLRATVAAAVRALTGQGGLPPRVTRIVRRLATRLDGPGVVAPLTRSWLSNPWYRRRW